MSKQSKEKKRNPKQLTPLSNETAAQEIHPEDNFLVVGIGASAGGLEALQALFHGMPAESGMAFVVVTHLDPTHMSMLPELMQKQTPIRVWQAESGLAVRPNNLYIIPPNREMEIREGVLSLSERPKKESRPIDLFFTSLAVDLKQRAVGVILSGMGTDGVRGLAEILKYGGRTLIQDPEDAKYDSMPRSALAAGVAQVVSPARDIPGQLNKAPSSGRPLPAPANGKLDTLFFNQMIDLLRKATGHDFSSYKEGTLIRRINRRMKAQQIEDPADYIRFVNQNSKELNLLFKEVLIHVTSFFRDPAAFKAFEERALPLLFKSKTGKLRVWVIGCSTGEEVYSIAILLQEYIRKHELDAGFQVFATDIDPDSIAFARAGIYPASIAADVSPDRLANFFVRDGNTYRVNRDLREKMVFSLQNIIKDPPFTRIDLISLRNLLIYLETEVQRRIFQVLDYSLVSGGVLFLGTSENIPESSKSFAPIDRKEKIYQRKPGDRGEIPHFRLALDGERAIKPGARNMSGKPGFATPLEKTLLEASPPSVIVDEKEDILLFHGRTGKYLEPHSGKARFNLLEMAREGLDIELPAALHKAALLNQPVVHRNIRVHTDGGLQYINVVVRPVERDGEKLRVVIFEDLPQPEEGGEKDPPSSGQRESREELQALRESLQATMEELQASNEEQKAIVEEQMATNEELQSANEELDSSREELQSLNEELTTANSEQQNRISEQALIVDELSAYMNNLGIASLLLDRDFRIKHFTAQISRIVDLIPADLGRPMANFVTKLKGENFLEAAYQVLHTGVPLQKEVESTGGGLFLLQVLPHRVDDKVEGVVCNFIDIGELKRTRDHLKVTQEALDLSDSIIETGRAPFLVLDKELKVLSANRVFYETFRVTAEDTVGKLVYQLGDGQWDIPPLRTLLEKVITQNESFKDYEVEHEFPAIGRQRLVLNALRVNLTAIAVDRILLSFEVKPVGVETP